mmetsp:Transcript_50904/g.84553  ORF Transcript_50904/g.84553 Transcript_50904/m.84553 type:complete len:204 (+) Transcript_50904:123-734(+)
MISQKWIRQNTSPIVVENRMLTICRRCRRILWLLLLLLLPWFGFIQMLHHGLIPRQRVHIIPSSTLMLVIAVTTRIGTSAQVENLSKQIELVLRLKRRAHGEHFEKHARTAPYIDRVRVSCGTQQDLGWSIPRRYYAVGFSGRRVRGIVFKCESKIAQLHLATIIDEYIRRLNIAMNDTALMTVSNALHDLSKEIFGHTLFQA